MKQFSRFIAVGIFNTLLGYSVIFSCSYLLGMSPEFSNAVGYTVGLILSYILNRYYTFNSRQSRRGEIIRFLSIFAFAYAVNFVVLLIMIYKLNMHEIASQIIAGLFYTVMSYLMNKFYVFKASNAG